MRKLLAALLLLALPCQAQETITDGLTLTIPSQGSTNWGTLFREDFAEPISGHDHTGSGKGLQLGAGAFASNALTGSGFRLDNNQYLRARNAANSADLNLLKADGSNKIIFDASNVDATTRTSLGLGTMCTQASSSVSITGGAISGATLNGALTSSSVTITGGSITGITDLAVADGGTGASNATTARSNLGAAASGANSDITSLTAVASVKNNGALAVGTTTNSPIVFSTNSVDRARFNPNLVPETGQTLSLGDSSNRWAGAGLDDNVTFYVAGKSVVDLPVDGISTAGTNLATATLLTGSVNVVTTCIAGGGVALPTSIVVGQYVNVIRDCSGGNSFEVYANTGHDIRGAGATSASLTVTSGAPRQKFMGIDSNSWIVVE